MNRIEEYLEEEHLRLKQKHRALNIMPGIKMVNGKSTGVPSITFYVAAKKLLSGLKPEEIIPKMLNGIQTDVVQLSTGDFKMGETSVSEQSPKTQRRIASGVLRKKKGK